MSEPIEAVEAEVQRLRIIRDQAQRVRDAQKKYFRTRLPADLVESKRQEGALDAMLAVEAGALGERVPHQGARPFQPRWPRKDK